MGLRRNYRSGGDWAAGTILTQKEGLLLVENSEGSIQEQNEQERAKMISWEEDGRYPNLIVGILSDSTAKTDRETKKQIDQDIFRTPDYFWFDPETEKFAGFHLVDGR